MSHPAAIPFSLRMPARPAGSRIRRFVGSGPVGSLWGTSRWSTATPGLGKSLLTLDLCTGLARVARCRTAAPGRAWRLRWCCNAEDGAEDTIRGRLEALGAARERVFVVDCAEDGWAMPVRLPSQRSPLDEAIAQHQAKLVVIDPVVAFLDPGIQTNSDQSVRRVLGALRQIAARRDCAILMVRHLNKDGRGQARYRGGGSIGFQALAEPPGSSSTTRQRPRAWCWPR